MRRWLLTSPVLLLTSVLWSGIASAQQASAAPAPLPAAAPAAAPAATPTPAAQPADKAPATQPSAKAPAAAKPKPSAKPAKPAKSAGKGAAKPPSKQATLAKKPRASGPPKEPDPAARRAVAGTPAPGDRGAPDSPEVRALRDADRELFGALPAAPSLRSADAVPVPAQDRDRPVVHANGLPPPPEVSTRPIEATTAEAEWLASLAQSDLPVRWNTRVVRYLSYYRNDPRGRALAASWFKRSGTYDALIRKTLRANGMPEDLIWVSLAESAFNPHAYSPAGAAGLWQFMPSTARLYGLVVDRWIDERLDPERSTDAAAKFLSDLHQRFGTWELALAAYNMGFGGLLSAVRKYNTNDFWELSRFEAGLPWETTLYVPKITSLAVIARNPAVFGIEGVVRDQPLAFETVEVPAGVSLSTVASAAGVELGPVEELNPQLLLSRTPPQPRAGSGSPLWPVRVPIGGAERYARNVVRVRAQDPAVQRYTVRAGDSLPEIARAHGVDVREVVSLNALDPDDVPQAGTVLLLPKMPKGDGAADKAVVMVAADLQPPPGYRRLFYRVLAGDTLSAVADGFGVTLDDLRRWNLLDPDARLQEGMALMLMVPVTRDVTGLPARGDDAVTVLVVGTDRFFEHHEAQKDRVRTTVVVRPNETWQQLASRTGMSVGMLERINRRSRSAKLEAGERLIAYVPGKLARVPKPAAMVERAESREPLAPPCPDDLPELPSPESSPVHSGPAATSSSPDA